MRERILKDKEERRVQNNELNRKGCIRVRKEGRKLKVKEEGRFQNDNSKGKNA